MRKGTILLSVATTILASPALHLDFGSQQKNTPTTIPRWFHRRNGLPPISQVIMALNMRTTTSKPLATQTIAPGFTVSSPTDISLPMTPPYAGPGILVLPKPSMSSQAAIPTSSNTTIASMRATSSQDRGHMTPAMRHFAVVGGAFGIIIFLVICCFFVMDPRIWKACSTSRKTKLHLARSQRFGPRPLPTWMQITPSPTSLDRLFEKKGAPVLSPYPYFLSDGLKSKFSMTTASDYSYCDNSFDTTTSSPQMSTVPYDRHGFPPALTPPLPSYAPAMDRVGRPDTSPVRPPRPPTTDSPATIESIYYADVDDPGFYRHPNPIILEPNSPIINNPPPVPSTSSKTPAHLNFLPQSHRFFSSVVLGLDALQRHNRSRSLPTLDTLSSRRLSGTSSVTRETAESSGPESDCSAHKPHRNRASTSAISWIRYSEFQQEHHLRLQQQSSDSAQPVSYQFTSPTKD